MKQPANRIPAGYFDGNPKKPFYINYIAVDRVTGEEKEMHPRDLPYEKRIEITDRFAMGLGYQRITAGT